MKKLLKYKNPKYSLQLNWNEKNSPDRFITDSEFEQRAREGVNNTIKYLSQDMTPLQPPTIQVVHGLYKPDDPNIIYTTAYDDKVTAYNTKTNNILLNIDQLRDIYYNSPYPYPMTPEFVGAHETAHHYDHNNSRKNSREFRKQSRKNDINYTPPSYNELNDLSSEVELSYARDYDLESYPYVHNIETTNDIKNKIKNRVAFDMAYSHDLLPSEIYADYIANQVYPEQYNRYQDITRNNKKEKNEKIN